MSLSLKPTHAAVKNYYAALTQVGQLHFSNEAQVSDAFAKLLADCGRKLHLTFIPQFPIQRARGVNIRVDGALIDTFHLAHGYWEAIANNRDGNRTQNFIYDSLNRIQQAYTNGSNWGETFSPTATNPGVAPSTPGIDAWGNLTNRSGVTGKTYSEPLNCPANTNNQLTTCSTGYDAAGNMTSNGSASYVYDGENRLVWTSGYRYIYDGHGQRVEKCQVASATTACPTSGTTGTLYWRGTGSDTLAETDLGGNDQEEYLFFNGQRIARRDTTSTGTTIAVHYYFSDHLGSHGVVENATGTACEQDIDYYPYGGVQNDYCAVVPQKYKFTGKERDTESGLDNFGARYHGSSLGRFMTPDPIHVMKQRLVDPQQWNMYAYVRNNPLRFSDPTGMFTCKGTKDQCAQIKAGYDAAKKALDAADPKSAQAKQLKSVLGFLGEPDKANGVAVTFGKLDTGVPSQTHTETTTDLMGTKHTTTTIKFDLQQLNPAVRLTSGHPLEPLGNDTGGVLVHEGTHGRDDLAQGHDPQSKAEALTTERDAYRNEGYVYDLLGVPSFVNPSLTAPEANRDQTIEELANASVDSEGW